MIPQDARKPADEPQSGNPASTEDVDVRATMDLTRQALEASAAEIERAKRLLRETEELIDLPVPPQPAESSDESGSS